MISPKIVRDLIEDTRIGLLEKATINVTRTPQDTSAASSEETETLIKRLRDEISVLKTQLLQLEQTADADPMVNVYNRRAFMREIGRAQTLMSRYDILCSVIFFDLNDFKKVNDNYGHSIGDDLLIKIADTLKAHVRDCDMVARIGGDEFGVLLFKTDAQAAGAKAANLACHIAEQHIDIVSEIIAVTSAWGVSACHPEDTPKQILHRADRAMYTHKSEFK